MKNKYTALILVGFVIVFCGQAYATNSVAKVGLLRSPYNADTVSVSSAAASPQLVVSSARVSNTTSQWQAAEYQSPSRYVAPAQDAPMSGTFAEYQASAIMAQERLATQVAQERANRYYISHPYGSYGYGRSYYGAPYRSVTYGVGVGIGSYGYSGYDYGSYSYTYYNRNAGRYYAVTPRYHGPIGGAFRLNSRCR